MGTFVGFLSHRNKHLLADYYVYFIDNRLRIWFTRSPLVSDSFVSWTRNMLLITEKTLHKTTVLSYENYDGAWLQNVVRNKTYLEYRQVLLRSTPVSYYHNYLTTLWEL